MCFNDTADQILSGGIDNEVKVRINPHFRYKGSVHTCPTLKIGKTFHIRNPKLSPLILTLALT